VFADSNSLLGALVVALLAFILVIEIGPLGLLGLIPSGFLFGRSFLAVGPRTASWPRVAGTARRSVARNSVRGP
jgi:hypothetical protein